MLGGTRWELCLDDQSPMVILGVLAQGSDHSHDCHLDFFDPLADVLLWEGAQGGNPVAFTPFPSP